MTTAHFHAGPANGHDFEDRNWPAYVRIAQAPDGAFRVLARLDDAGPDDRVSVYQRAARQPASYRHLDVTGERSGEAWRAQAVELHRGPSVSLSAHPQVLADGEMAG